MSNSGNKAPRRLDDFLHVKLMPPRLHSDAIQRADLLKRLDEALTRKLTLITAPTGFGKTTLVSMWNASRDDRSAWVILDENDNDPVRFWTYVCSALRTLDPSLGKATLSTLAGSQVPSFHALLSPLINDLTRLKTNSVLILDDYQVIVSDEINKGLSFLIQHLPDTVHLILLSRSEPSLPFGVWRARGDVTEITVADLRFDRVETDLFLQNALSMEMPQAIVLRLQERTEGWVAGLQLAVLSMQNRNLEEIEKVIQSFSGSHRYVSDYLIKEVFDNQPETIRSFLLKTCFLNRMTASLCDELTETNNGATMLERLERENLFVVQLEHGNGVIWYRYNPLFAESIQHLAKQRLSEETVQKLFEKTSDWYEYHGLLEDAIETALTAKLFARVMPLIEKFIEMRDLSQGYTIGHWLEKIHQEEIFKHPIICFTHAQIILYSTDRYALTTVARIEPFLRTAESIWRTEEDHARLGQLLSFRGIVAWWQGDFAKAFDLAHQSLIELPEHDVLWRGNSLLILNYEAVQAGRILDAQTIILEARALLGAAQNIYGVLAAIQMLAEVFYWQGEFEQAEQLNRQILTDAVGDASMLDDQGIASLSLANIAYEQNDLEQAEQLANRALELGTQRANEMLQMQATFRLAHIHAARGNISQARDLVKALEAKIQKPVLLREIHNKQVLLSIRAGDVSSLDWWVKIITTENENVLPLERERESFNLARLRIAQTKPGKALEVLHPWLVDATNNGRVRSLVEALCLEALAYFADADLLKANKSLVEALTLGQSKGFRRTFLDEGTRMAALLQAFLPSLPNRTLSLFATTLLHSFPMGAMPLGAGTRSEVQIEALSQQEIRVLRLLVAGLSNADIARELVVSTNTIKTHVKSVYRKLNVKSREEVRDVARELKLL
jgi:LuxR family maltose regulon positive regulatory protein